MNWPTYPTAGCGPARIYDVLKAAWPEAVECADLCRAYYQVETPSAEQLKRVKDGNGRLRDWLRGHGMTLVSDVPLGRRAHRFRIVVVSAAAEGDAAQSAARRSHLTPSTHRVVEGQRISLPRLSFLDGPIGEARAC